MPCLYYTTTKTKEEAENIITYLLSNRLIAGANIFPIGSKYWWQEDNKGEYICSDNEYAVFMQSTEQNFSNIENAIKERHSYEVPCIIRINIDAGSNDFLEWIKYYSSAIKS